MASPKKDTADDAKRLDDIITRVGEIDLTVTPDPEFIDTTATLSKVVGSLEGLPTEPPSLYFDLEGINLCRHGSVSILQIYVLPSHRTFLIDVHSLGDTCFSAAADNGCTLKTVLESSAIPKVFFDVRNDSDALYSHFGIKLAGVCDIQLMEIATRFSKKFVNGLSRCVETGALMTYKERANWIQIKNKGVKLFAPEKGGTYDVFNQRPLPRDIANYCAQDVQVLPRLWSFYDEKLSSAWKKNILRATEDRIELSQSADYVGKGRHMALGPPSWQLCPPDM